MRATQFPQYLRASVIKALVGKRSGWKIGWNEQTDLPDVSVVDPRMLFFDENAAIWRDCRYYIHLIEMSSREWNKRVQAGIYRDVGNVQPEAPDSKLTIVPSTLKPSYPRKVVYVYEYYDLEEGFVMHIPKDADSPCFEGPLAYNPFVMFNLDINGQIQTKKGKINNPLKNKKSRCAACSFLKIFYTKKYAKRTFIIRSLAVRKIW